MEKKLLMKPVDPIRFAYVMATGIISIAFHKLNFPYLSELFLALASIGYIWLLVLFGIRFFMDKKRMIQEFCEVQGLLRYFTFSAGTDALAVRFILQGSFNTLGLILGIIGGVSTLLLVYSLFYRLFIQTPSSIRAISPYWLLMTIACNSVGIVITTLWEHAIYQNELLLLVGFGFWTFAVGFYFIFMSLNIYRVFFQSFEGKELSPAYWTWMGAAAIAVVDGGLLVLIKQVPPFLASLTHFFCGMTFVLWVFGSALIPILCLMVICKYSHFKVALSYTPSLWAMVFPLGMYTVATDLLSSSFQLQIVKELAFVFLWISVLAWILVAYSVRFDIEAKIEQYKKMKKQPDRLPPKNFSAKI